MTDIIITACTLWLGILIGIAAHIWMSNTSNPYDKGYRDGRADERRNTMTNTKPRLQRDPL